MRTTLKHLAFCWVLFFWGGCASMENPLPEKIVGGVPASLMIIMQLENKGRVVHEFSEEVKKNETFSMNTDQFIRIPVGANLERIDQGSPKYFYSYYPNGPVVNGRITLIRKPENPFIESIPLDSISDGFFHSDCKTVCIHVMGSVKWTVDGNRQIESIQLNTKESFFDAHCHLDEWQSVEIGGADEPWQILKIKFEKAAHQNSHATRLD